MFTEIARFTLKNKQFKMSTRGSTMRVLSDIQIQEIRDKYASGNARQEDLAHDYNCSVFTISIWLGTEARRVKAFTKRIRLKVCDCGLPYTAHPRCPTCTQLLHGICDCKNDKPYFSQDINNFL